MSKFLIATDGSPAARAAVSAGVQLAAERGGGVVFLHVTRPVETRVEHSADDGDDVLRDAAAVAEEHGVPYELRLVPGLAVDVILTTADEVDAELIVVGSNRHGAIATAFFGSVSRVVLKHSRRPVLVVHPTPARLYAHAGV